MERTPSPPRRVHTPPAPLHGAKHDTYEPYSPRRSSRVAAQRELHHEQTSPPRSRVPRDVTPTPVKKRSVNRASISTLSPPASPTSPSKHRSPRSVRRPNPEPTVAAADSDSDHVAPTPARRFLSAMEPRGMLPTPAKTPRKRPLQSESSLSSTARVLFPGRQATLEEVAPTPRKSRKNKDIFALDGFGDQTDEPSEKIEIYTDSKDRVPTLDENEENPFVTSKGKGKAKAAAQKPRKVDAKTAKMNKAVERDEGMVYLFRGKKIFRKFDDDPSLNAEEGPESSGDEFRRQAGSVTHRPLTRSAIKPRLLFQEEIKQRNRQNGHDEDEEATTDIEAPIATPSRKLHKGAGVSTSASASAAQEITPPPTVSRPKREISFDSWSRVKSSSTRSREGKKRSGPPLESSTDKRARSEHSSVMSTDSF